MSHTRICTHAPGRIKHDVAALRHWPHQQVRRGAERLLAVPSTIFPRALIGMDGVAARGSRHVPGSIQGSRMRHMGRMGTWGTWGAWGRMGT
eukprot:365387-Chlamydomonas_euryale.AAC.25